MKNYDDIINLEHPTSKKHPRMSKEARACQFAPFAALTGYDDEIKEAGRLTSACGYLSEDSKVMLDLKLSIVNEIKDIEVVVSYFVPDSKKQGGSFKSISSQIKKVDNVNQTLVLVNNIVIPLKNVCDIDAEIFRQMNLHLDII